MKCFEYSAVRALGGLAILISSVTALAGQLDAQSPDKMFLPERKGAQVKEGKKLSVSLQLKDSTIHYVLYEIARQSKLRVVYDDSDTFSQRKISISINQKPPMQAFAEVLKGTGFAARFTSDGETVIIHAVDSRGDPGKQDRNGQDGNNIITGRVIDSSGRTGIQGATVTLIGTTNSVTTDKTGVYTLVKIPPGKHQMSVKVLGYQSVTKTIEVREGVRATLNIALNPSAASLNEVVTTATGLQRRVEVPSDIVRVDGDKIRQRAPVRSVTDMLEAAQIPGVVITRASGDPGAATRIRIRGIGSISQSNDPVYIVDGIWVDAARADQIDPETIETFEVVRGPSAATLYGQDASNGVIVITTKKGTPGTTRWDVKYSRDWGRAYGKIPPFYEGHGYNQITGVRMLCPIVAVLEFRCVQDSVAMYDPNNRMVLREGQERRDEYSLSLDGGSNTVRYALTASTGDVLGVRRAAPIDLIKLRKLSLRYDDDILRPSRLRDHSLTSNLSIYPRENLDVLLTVKAGLGDLTDNSYNFTLYHTDNPLSLDTAVFLTDGNERSFNQNRKVTHTNTTSFGSTINWRAKYDFLVKVTGGIDQTSRNETGSKTVYNCVFTECIDDLGTRNEGTGTTTVSSLRTNISKVLNMGRLSRFIELRPTIGFDFRNRKQDNFTLLKDSVPGGESSIESGRVQNALGRRIEVADAGWYLNTTVGIFEKLYFDVGIRQDIGSAITSSSNTTYPKLGTSWLVSNEGFWPQNDIIGLLRVRATIGYAAVQPDVTDIKGSYITGTKFVDGKLVKSLELVKVGNSELVPERAVELELGFDMEVWKDRITLIGNYAHKENKNALVSTRLPESFGRSGLTRKENIGRVQNRNVELTINTIALDKDWLRVNVDYSHSITTNRVKSLGRGTSRLIRGGITSEGAEVIAVGYPLGSVWKRSTIGFFDENGDGILGANEVITNDSLSYVGTSNPRYTGSYGVNTMIFGKIMIDSRFTYQSDYVTNYTPTSRVDYGSQDVTAPLYVQAQSRALGLGNISNFRWNSASISYSFSPRRISFLNTRSMSVSLQGTNLGLWTKFVGRDPWVNTAISTASEVITVDEGFTPPPPRTFALNIRMGL